MIGKNLYIAKIVDDNVKLSSYEITGEVRNVYKLNRKFKGLKQCRKDDVGVILFLTEQEAKNYIIKELEHFVNMGEKYLIRTKLHLLNAKKIKIPVK